MKIVSLFLFHDCDVRFVCTLCIMATVLQVATEDMENVGWWWCLSGKMATTPDTAI